MHEEYLDIVDENDQVVGKDTRDNIYKRGLDRNIRVVNILIFNTKGELLLPRRSLNRRIFPGCYDFSCGEHVESGEDYLAAAKRGLKEELDLDPDGLIELDKLTPKDGVNMFMKVYKLFYTGKIEKYDTEGIERLEWHTLKNVLEMIKKDKSTFKSDLPIVLEWYVKKFN